MKIIGNKPDDAAEKILYDIVSKSNFEGLSCFNFMLPSVPEIDCILWGKEFGFFVLETKGFKIDHFRGLSLDKINFSEKIHQEKYGSKQPPWKQAIDNSKKLASYFKSLLFKKVIFSNFNNEIERPEKYIPYIFSASFFPFISNESFNMRFPQFHKLLSNFIIFSDDIKNDQILKEKLINIGNELISHNKQKTKKEYYLEIISFFSEDKTKEYESKVFLFNTEKPKIKKYDEEKLKFLESVEIKNDTRHISYNHPVYRYGYAGSGKTIIALSILKNFAKQNFNVLFTCFNKVLASDFRRYTKYSYLDEYKYLEKIVFKDIHQVIGELEFFENKLEKYFNTDRKNIFEKNLDSYYTELVNKIINENEFNGIYDYILVDESQDLKDYGWKLILYLAKNRENSLIIIDGKEQNLYSESPSPYLTKISNVAKSISESNKDYSDNYKRKNRIFRNSSSTFLISQAFLEFYPNSKRSIDFINMNIAKQSDTFEFNRDSEKFPYLRFVKNGGRDLYANTKNAIEYFISESKKMDLGYHGILILVPFSLSKNKENNFYRNLAVRILHDLNIDFIDYTNDSNRRLEYSESQIRLVTYHSARGIEANFSIVLGFEELLNTGYNCDYHKLAYIVLSRAIFESVFYINCSNQKTSDFSEKISSYFSEIYESIGVKDQYIKLI